MKLSQKSKIVIGLAVILSIYFSIFIILEINSNMSNFNIKMLYEEVINDIFFTKIPIFLKFAVFLSVYTF